MEWAKLGANVGAQVVKMVYDTKRNEELHEVRRERDVYKKEAECLKSHLRDVKRLSNGNAYKPSAHNKRDFNKGHLQTAKKGTISSGENQFVEKKSHGNSSGFGKNNSQKTHQESSRGSSTSNNAKTNYSFSNSSHSSGRGASHSRGRGGGRGNGNRRGNFHQ